MGFLSKILGSSAATSRADTSHEAIRKMFDSERLHGTKIEAVAILHRLDIAPYPPRQMAEMSIQHAKKSRAISSNVELPSSATIEVRELFEGENLLECLASMLAEQLKDRNLPRISAIALEGGGRHGGVWTGIAAQ
ncbi:MAG: hypothetical protein H6Q86_2229 [candidate division NC10 bacterium]|nr:hypothetical protein [candidate division NC10 bacterium]